MKFWDSDSNNQCIIIKYQIYLVNFIQNWRTKFFLVFRLELILIQISTYRYSIFMETDHWILLPSDSSLSDKPWLSNSSVFLFWSVCSRVLTACNSDVVEGRLVYTVDLRLYFKNSSCSRFFRSQRFLLAVIIRPDTPNSSSDAALLAGGYRYSMATLLIGGN